MAILYRITFPDGKAYLGVTKFELHRRLRNHAHVARSGSSFPVSKAIREFGLSRCKAETLVVGDKSYLLELEERAIVAFGSAAPNGYNAYVGSKLTSLYPRSGASNGMFGKKHSAETRLKISQRRNEQ